MQNRRRHHHRRSVLLRTALSQGVGWWDSSPDLVGDFDYLLSRFRWNGQSFADEPTFNTAVGATKASNQRTFGPYIDPAAPNLITNGTFDTDFTGWTDVLNGASTKAIVAAAARLTSDASSGTGAGGAGITQTITTDPFQGYVEEFTRASSQSGSRIGSTLYGFDLGGISANASGANSGPFSARTTSSFVYHFRTAAGATDIDNVKVRAAVPFKNFTSKGASYRIRAVTPAVASGEKTVLALYSTSISDVCAVFWNASGELHARVIRGSTTQADLNFGTVAPSTAFDLLLTLKANVFLGQLNTGVAVADLTGELPGHVLMKINESPVASTQWDGGQPRVQIYAGGGSEQFYAMAAGTILTDGDSFFGGAHSLNLGATLQTVAARSVYNTGHGGDTIDQIAARIAAVPAALKAKPIVIWDGDHNGFTSIAAYCDALATGLAGYSKVVSIPVCVNYGQVDISEEAAIRDEMLLRWPNNLLDWRNVLTLDGNGVPVASMYFDKDTDTTHLSQAAMDLMAPAIVSFINAKGW